MPALRVGVIIVTFEAATFIGRCLTALAAQTRRPDRVVLVDNGSTDGTLQVVARVAGASGLAIEDLPQGENVGFARANNLGVAALDDCDWIALLNPDAFPEPGWLAALTAATSGIPTRPRSRHA